MKTDKLEQFIHDNRDNFDDQEPGADLWNKIKKPESKVRIFAKQQPLYVKISQMKKRMSF